MQGIKWHRAFAVENKEKEEERGEVSNLVFYAQSAITVISGWGSREEEEEEEAEEAEEEAERRNGGNQKRRTS